MHDYDDEQRTSVERIVGRDVDEAGLDDARREQLWSYLQMTAQHMVNSGG